MRNRGDWRLKIENDNDNDNANHLKTNITNIAKYIAD